MYSGFSHQKWWFSIAMLNYQRVTYNYVFLLGYLRFVMPKQADVPGTCSSPWLWCPCWLWCRSLACSWRYPHDTAGFKAGYPPVIPALSPQWIKWFDLMTILYTTGFSSFFILGHRYSSKCKTSGHWMNIMVRYFCKLLVKTFGLLVTSSYFHLATSSYIYNYSYN